MTGLRRRTFLGTAGIGAAGAMLGGMAEGAGVDGPAANRRVVLALIQRVWREGRLEELPSFWTADCVNHADPSPDRRGLAALRRYHEGFAAWFADYDQLRIVVEQQVAEGDRVVTQMTAHAIHRASARPVALATIRIDRLAGGRIAEHWSVADMAGLQRQLA